jgi:hypothetical protein
MHAYQFANSSGCSCASVSRSFHCADISAYKYRYVARSYILFAKQLYIRGFDHGIGGFNCADEPFGLNHSECF